MLRSLLVVALSLVVTTSVEAAPLAGGPAGPVDLAAPFERLEKAGSAKDRLAAAETVFALAKANPDAAIEVLSERLSRPQKTTEPERRAVLDAFQLELPDDKGKFRVTPLRKGEPDWLADVATAPDSPALDEVLERIVVLRGLAATERPAAAERILEYVFTPEGLIYRDEGGRLLRQMDPHSLPTLLRASAAGQTGGDKAMDRYADYQLDVLQKNRPSYALDAAPSEELEVAMLKAIQSVRHPDAVGTVLERTDAPSPSVRVAARRAWWEYVKSKPPAVPKRKLKLAGGEMTEEEVPLYYDYQQLATVEIRTTLEKLTGTAPPETATLEDMTNQLFAWFDERRAGEYTKSMDKAREMAQGGDLAGAAKVYDQILLVEPTFPGRQEMADVYLRLGTGYLEDEKWEQAAEELYKATSLAVEEETRKQADTALARARHMRMRDAAPDGAAVAASDPVGPEPRSWLLYGGLVSLVAAIVLGVLFWTNRRRLSSGQHA